MGILKENIVIITRYCFETIDVGLSSLLLLFPS
jgi:hypothetical protein